MRLALQPPKRWFPLQRSRINTSLSPELLQARLNQTVDTRLLTRLVDLPSPHDWVGKVEQAHFKVHPNLKRGGAIVVIGHLHPTESGTRIDLLVRPSVGPALALALWGGGLWASALILATRTLLQQQWHGLLLLLLLPAPIAVAHYAFLRPAKEALAFWQRFFSQPSA